MPTGKKLTSKQRADIMLLHTTTDKNQKTIAKILKLGDSTVSRVIAQETKKQNDVSKIEVVDNKIDQLIKQIELLVKINSEKVSNINWQFWRKL